MLYFGTSTNEYGHYLWELTGGLYRNKDGYSSIPFDPYEYKDKRRGEGIFVLEKQYTALHIPGSPKDTRAGTVSVFYVNEVLSPFEFLGKIRENPIAMALINKMPFSVKTSAGDLKE